MTREMIPHAQAPFICVKQIDYVEMADSGLIYRGAR
ncbi:hypothetical protein ABIC86_002790 [Paenibacillus sp. DS2363]